MGDGSELKRVAFSPGEFAKLFGKSQTWGYRQIYAGKVKAITAHGRILIPAAEVEAILKTAGIYDGMKLKALKGKAELQSLAPKLRNVWQLFLAARRQSATRIKRSSPAAALKGTWLTSPASREAALARLTRSKNKRGEVRRGGN